MFRDGHREDIVDAALRFFFAPVTFEHRPELIATYRNKVTSYDQAQAQAIFEVVRSIFNRSDISEEIAAIQARTLVLGGKKDITAPPEELEAIASRIPNAITLRRTWLDPVFEPVQHKIAGAVRDLTDSSGDARIFTEALARVGREKLGLTIQLGTRVGELESAGDRVQAVFTTRGTLTADVYVLALGVAAPLVARTIGVGLQVYPAKGYSSTFPIKTGDRAPTIPGVDEQWLVGWSRLGDRLRLTSTAEFAGYDRSWTPRDFNNIMRFARDMFPDVADWDRGDYRACLRPMTPDGPPVLGYGHHRNLLFNVGHGHMGWTMACGTARIVADLLAGRRPELDLEGLAPRRAAGGR